jgi:hypothetical protein
VAECKVENPQPKNRSVYFENPYMNVYVRERTCSKCSGTFKTYEIGESSFKAMRKCLEMSDATGALIDQTWARTRKEFSERKKKINEKPSVEEVKYEQELKKEPSYLGKNVISLFRGQEKDE